MSRNGNGKTRMIQQVRCAIYTRKSTEEGLEQEFNSLDAQREAAEAYVASQQHEGWVWLPDRYDDGGYTGANMERPALRRLLDDIEDSRIDCVAVYKVDRISRSLLDFARMMETFEKHQVSFVSVTQHFNTATPMGRLILNILLSFAQFERELISERTRDKIAAARRKGKWSGGMPVHAVEGRPEARADRGPRARGDRPDARADPGLPHRGQQDRRAGGVEPRPTAHRAGRIAGHRHRLVTARVRCRRPG